MLLSAYENLFQIELRIPLTISFELSERQKTRMYISVVFLTTRSSNIWEENTIKLHFHCMVSQPMFSEEITLLQKIWKSWSYTENYLKASH